MALSSNVVRRGAVYYLRVAVPVDLRGLVKGREVWRSLRTKEPREARRRGAEALSRLHGEWEGLRGGAGERVELGRQELHDAAVQLYADELDRDERRRATLPTQADVDALRDDARIAAQALPAHEDREIAIVKAAAGYLVARDAASHDRESRARLVAELRRHVATGETALVTAAADEAIERGRLKVERGTPGYRRLCLALARAWIEALERMGERDRGDFAGAPADDVLKPAPGEKAPAVAKPGESVLELFAEFEGENPRNIKPDTMRMNREIIQWFTSFVGPRFPASRIDKVTVRDWKALLRKFPVKAAETREFRGLTMRKIVERNEQLGKPPISARTVNKYLSALGGFCHWLTQHAYLDSNPTTGMHTTLDKDEAKVLPYTSEQLTTIFTSPLFTGCESDERLHPPGEHRVRDHRYWLPLLSLFTGARLGELGQLHTADVRELHGQWIIHITREGDREKSTKTKGSQRVVPVHPELIRLGFLDYLASRVGEKRLFPKVETNSRGQVGGEFSRGFNRYVRRIGVKEDRKLNFHSFRHGLADALRRAGKRDEEFGFLLGHTKATTTGRYGIMPEGELSQRVELINAVAFPGLDLTHLCPK